MKHSSSSEDFIENHSVTVDIHAAATFLSWAPQVLWRRVAVFCCVFPSPTDNELSIVSHAFIAVAPKSANFMFSLSPMTHSLTLDLRE